MGNLGLTFFWLLLLLTSVFMILLILIQRGRGGGITGALGGAGGQSAFGSKTGDVFTKITVYTAVIWIMLSILTISFFNRPELRNPIAKPPGTTTTAPGTGKVGEESKAGEESAKEAAADVSLDAGGEKQPADEAAKPAGGESPSTAPPQNPDQGGKAPEAAGASPETEKPSTPPGTGTPGEPKGG